jgi:hypothetical protein
MKEKVDKNSESYKKYIKDTSSIDRYLVLKFYSNNKLIYYSSPTYDGISSVTYVATKTHRYTDTTQAGMGIFTLKKDSLLFTSYHKYPEGNRNIFIEHKGIIKNIDTLQIYIPKNIFINASFDLKTHIPVYFVRKKLSCLGHDS